MLHVVILRNQTKAQADTHQDEIKLMGRTRTISNDDDHGSQSVISLFAHNKALF